MSRLWPAVSALLLCASCVQPPPTRSDVSTRFIEYHDGGVAFESLLALKTTQSGRRPSILLVTGPTNTPAALNRATTWASAGYLVLVADLFGKGPSPRNLDRATAVHRLQLALEQLEKRPEAQPHKVAGVGYGLGGAYLLEMVRSGADLTGIACVHGELTRSESSPTKMTSRVLLLTGSDDPAATFAKLGEFESEMRQGNVDWDIIRYGGVGPAFTDPASKTYDPDADQRSQAAMRQFVAELFPARTFAKVQLPEKAKTAAVTGIPDEALKVLRHIDEHDSGPDGYEGGRSFGNFERRLPQTDRQNRRIRYREWDIHPLRPNRSRGPERLVTGSDGSAYYTSDHYASFKKIRSP